VLAAFRAAARRTRGPFVRAAFRADARRSAAERRFADAFACRDNAADDATRRLSRFNAWTLARARRLDGRERRLALRLAVAALRFVEALALRGGGPSLTPDRRAFERPIAIACLVDRAPCFPSRM
jgi:hypothetical protein